jgi:NAD(P)-dependent dehydrogenase (short-subunit alcohol dehydrogenase family)
MGSVRLDGRTAVVTGATSGIGTATALGLARMGARVVAVGRSRERAEQTRERIVRESGNREVEIALADFSSLDQVRGLGAEILKRCPQLQLLVDNAGLLQLRRSVTVDGFETTFAVNHLAHFLLTRILLERLIASAPSRIVVVSSEAHRFGELDLDDLQSERGYAAMRVYGRSKSANLLFATALARRLEGTGVTVNSVHPGAVSTRLGQSNLPAPLARVLSLPLRLLLRSPARGAETSLYVATSPELEGVSGRYFADCREKRPAPAAVDPERAERLWRMSEAMCGLAPEEA